MAQVYSWRNDSDVRNLLLRAVQALSEGRLVLLPTDTGYCLCADLRHPNTLAAHANAPRAIGLAGPEQARQLVPSLGPLALRLARRCWPGPLTLLVASPESEAVPVEAIQDGFLALSCPAHEAILTVMDALVSPLLLTPFPEGPGGTLPEEVAVAIEDGPPVYPEGPSVVHVVGDRWEMVKEGALSAAQIEAQLGTLIVFVCTGNTCRSPMAEALCKKRLAERLGCLPEELPRRGWVVMSAGLAAYPGDLAASAAREIAHAHGMDLSTHRSRPLNPEIAAQADQIICMTRSHLTALVDHYPSLGCTPRLLSCTGEDLSDPVGQDETVYRACAERIWSDLDSLVNDWVSR
jgi:protein-tyrosine phosphatase